MSDHGPDCGCLDCLSDQVDHSLRDLNADNLVLPGYMNEEMNLRKRAKAKARSPQDELERALYFVRHPDRFYRDGVFVEVEGPHWK